MMDISESIKIVRDRIQAIEPQHASKIVGYLLQNYGDEDMIRLAFSPDNVIENETYKVLQTKWLTNFYMSPSLGNSPIQYGTPHQSFTDPRPCLTSNNVLLKACSKVIEEQFQRSLKIENDYIDSELYNNTNYTNYLDHQPAFTDFRSNRFCRRSIEFPPKVCHYFNKGYCKHGNNCKFLHGLGSDARGYENGDDDHNVFSLGSLDKLEIDLIELLRSRKGDPIPIASLPMTYYNKFHRTIQAEGYLTESQRQGKVAGCSLTRLLGRLKTSIRVIERPDGQRSVILAQDAAKYCHARIEQGGFIPESRQIYLTFPPESVFTEIDVSDYFTKYGPVQDVRIPSQDKRMFGFVIFVEPSTTKIVLKKGNPHYICGARVLVKPYREKPRLSDRKHVEKPRRSISYKPRLLEGEPDFQSSSDYSRLMKQKFMEQHKSALELQRTTFFESQLLPKPSARLQYFANSIDELRLAQEFPTMEQFDSRLNNQNIGSSSEDNFNMVNNDYNDERSNEVLNLPDNPFEPAIANIISTTTI